MLLGAAIFPQTSKYGGGPEKMAIVAARQRWRRRSGQRAQLGLGFLQASKMWRNYRTIAAAAALGDNIKCAEF